MVKVESGGQVFYMDGYLQANIDEAKRVIRKDFDMVFCVDGTEGGGKSVLAMQIAKYCDPTFNLDRVCMTSKEFTDAIMKAEKYQAVIYDEAYTGLSSKDTMGSVNKAICQMLAEIRQKNLFVFIVMPTFFDLTKYVALWRSRALIHVYLHNGFERGYYRFFNTERKKEMYVYGKKTYNYNAQKPNFIGSFTKFYTVDEEAYRQKKFKALQMKERQGNKYGDMAIDKIRKLCYHVHRKGFMSQQDIAEILGVNQARVSAIIQAHEKSIPV